MLRFILWILAMLGVRVVRLRVSRLAPVECAGLDPPTVTLNASTRPGGNRIPDRPDRCVCEVRRAVRWGSVPVCIVNQACPLGGRSRPPRL